MKIAFITDTSSGLANNPEQDLYCTPLMINVAKGKNVTSYKDELEINLTKLFEFQDDPETDISTAQPINGNLISLIEEALKKYDKVVLIPLSKKLSGTYETWKLLSEETYKNKVYVVDSCTTLAGLKFLIDDLKEFVKKNPNFSFDEMGKFVNDRKNKESGILILTDPSPLIKGGRLSSFKGFIFKLTKLKIVIELTPQTGKLNFVTKTSSDEKAIELALDAMDKTCKFKNRQIKKVAFFSTILDKKTSEEKYKKIQSIIKKYDSSIKIEKTNFTPSIATHTGKNTYAFYLVTK